MDGNNPAPFGNVLQGMTMYCVVLKSMAFSKHTDKETPPDKQGCFNPYRTNVENRVSS